MFVFCSAHLHFSLLGSVSGHSDSSCLLWLCHVLWHAHIPAEGCSGLSRVSLLRTGLHMPVSAAVDSHLEVGSGSELCVLVALPMVFQPA